MPNRYRHQQQIRNDRSLFSRRRKRGSGTVIPVSWSWRRAKSQTPSLVSSTTCHHRMVDWSYWLLSARTLRRIARLAFRLDRAQFLQFRIRQEQRRASKTRLPGRTVSSAARSMRVSLRSRHQLASCPVNAAGLAAAALSNAKTNRSQKMCLVWPLTRRMHRPQLPVAERAFSRTKTLPSDIACLAPRSGVG